jgi:hypothetical protein
MACKFIVNGQESVLYNKILEAYNGDEELATVLHSYFKNDNQFIKNFGNWEQDMVSEIKSVDYVFNKDISRIEENGEPQLFKNETLRDYYYIDKDNNKVYIITNTKSLNSLFENSEIEQLTKVLVRDFFKNNLKIDFENIDLTNKSADLKSVITNKINERISVFRASEDILFEERADLLEQALANNLDEILKNVVDSFEQSKIKYKKQLQNTDEDLTLSEIEEIENEKNPTFGKASFESSTKGNITANVEFRLSLIEDLTEKDYFLNDVVYKSFDSIYNDLLKVLNNVVAIELNGVQEDKFELLKSEILKLVNKKPYFKELYRILSQEDISENIKNEFTVAFNLNSNNFNTTEITETIVDKAKVIDITVKNVAKSSRKESDVLFIWNKNFKEDFVTLNDNGRLVVNEQDKLVLLALKKKLDKINVFQQEAVNNFVEILRDLGVESTEKGFLHFLDNSELVNNDKGLSEKLFNNAIRNLKFFLRDITTDQIKNLDNSFLTQGLFKELAIAESFYLVEQSDSSVFTAGKQKWTFSYPSYLSNTILSWKKDRSILENHYYSSKSNESSYWIKHLLALGDTYEVDDFLPRGQQELLRIEESKKRINAIELGSFNVLQTSDNSSEPKDGKQIDKKAYILDTVNKAIAFNKNVPSYHRTTTPGDKATQYELNVGVNVPTNARYGGEHGIVLNANVIDIVFGYFNGEYKRMKFERAFMNNEKNKNKLITYYHLGAGNAFKSQFFPGLSNSSINATAKDFGSDFNLIYNENGDAYLEDLKGSVFEESIKSYIAKQLSEDISNTVGELTEKGLFKQKADSSYENLGIDSKVWSSYGSNPELKVASDFFINGLISQVEYSKMFAGDIAYYKNPVDYKKRIPATYTDGLYQRLSEKNKNINIAVIQSVNIGSPFHSEIEELIGETIAKNYAEGEINSADAQAWITPARWKDVWTTLGKWNNVYQSAYEKMMGENREPFTNEELKKVAQPIKGVYFQNVNGQPIFLKYSQAVLSPRLRKGNDLEILYNKMVNNKDANGELAPIDEILTFDAIKVGSNLPSLSHNAEGRIVKDFELNVMTIPANGWKLQQDLPTKSFKQTDLGSQLQKNIFQGLAFNLDKLFEVNDDEELTGNEMIQAISEVVGDLTEMGYESILKEFGIDDNSVISNINGFYSLIISELKSRNGSKNVIKALEAETTIYGIPQAQKKLQNIFSSIMTKRILKIKTNGGSFIQMSNYGLNKENAENQKVIWSPNALSTVHEPQFLKDEKGEYVLSKSGKKIIRPGGILISGSFLAKYIPNYADFDAVDLFVGRDGKLPMIDKQIQDNIIGYRIPNQGLSSNDALQIVGILPEENGDTIVAYTGITKKTGSDFDIDKMYIMFPSVRPVYNKTDEVYNYVNQTLKGNNFSETTLNYFNFLNKFKGSDTEIDIELIKNEFESLKTDEEKYEFFNNQKQTVLDILLNKENADVDIVKEVFKKFDIKVKRLQYIKYDSSKKTKEGLQNRLIELYKTVLLNENVIADVMTPIDFNFMEDDIKNIYKEERSTNLSIVNPLRDIDVKYSFLAGKAGVGQQANALMDYVLGSLSNLSITNLDIPKSNIRFDSEFSTELSSEDLAYYKEKLDLSDEQLNQVKSIKIGNSLSAVLNAFVDIAKDPFITKAGWVTMTTNTGNLLLRAGLHPFYVNALLSQTVIKDYVEFSEQYEQSNSQGLSTLDAFIKQEFGKDTWENTKKKNVLNLPLKSLRESIGKKGLQSDRMNTLYTFLNYQGASKVLKENIDASKFMVNGLGQNVTSLRISKNLVDSINQKEERYNNGLELNPNKNVIQGFETKFVNPNGTESSFSKIYNFVITKPLKIVKANPKLFLSANETIQQTFNEISHGISGDILTNDELGVKLESSFYSYTMSGFKQLKMNIDEKRYLLTTFVKEFEKFQVDNDGIYSLVDELIVKSGEKKTNYISLNNRSKSNEFEDKMTGSFMDLLNNEPEFAENLIKYSYLTSGFTMNSNQFFTYIPTEWFIRNQINRFIIDTGREYDNYGKINDNTFIDQFFLDRLEDKKIVKNIGEKQITTVLGKKDIRMNGFVTKKQGKAPYYFTKSTENGKIHYKLIGYTADFEGIYSRFTLNTKGEYVDIQPLNAKDKQGNKIFSFSKDGLILKATSSGVAKLADKAIQDFMQNNVFYNRDYFFRGSIVSNESTYDDLVYDKIDNSKEPMFVEPITKDETEKIDTVESLRAEEQVELQQAFPNIKPINGKIEKESLSTAEDIATFEEIYDRYDKLITPLLNNQSQDIYNKLGNKTESGNVVIKSVYQQKGVAYAKSIGGVFSMRTDNSETHFGNPFSSVPTEIAKGLIPTESTKESVEKYIDWVINGFLTNDKVIYGHPGIGKTFLKESKNNNIIDFDSDYKIEINKKFNLKKGFKARNDFQKSNPEEYKNEIRSLWKLAKEESQKTNKKLFASDMILLREFSNDFDKVITMSKETFINRAKQRDDFTPGLDGTESWKNNLDIEINKINKSKIISTNKYLSELFQLDDRASWIKEQLKSGALKSKPIVYYKELGEASHATALDYLINRYDWNTQPVKAITPLLDNQPQVKPQDKSDLLKTLFTKDNESSIAKGSVVDYNNKKWIVWNISDTGKAQLIDTEGNKFSGTPNSDKLTKIGDYTTTVFDGTDYIVTGNENIYSLATGKQVFTNGDGSTASKKAKIISQIMEENDLVLPETNFKQVDNNIKVSSKITEFIKKSPISNIINNYIKYEINNEDIPYNNEGWRNTEFKELKRKVFEHLSLMYERYSNQDTFLIEGAKNFEFNNKKDAQDTLDRLKKGSPETTKNWKVVKGLNPYERTLEILKEIHPELSELEILQEANIIWAYNITKERLENEEVGKFVKSMFDTWEDREKTDEELEREDRIFGTDDDIITESFNAYNMKSVEINDVISNPKFKVALENAPFKQALNIKKINYKESNLLNSNNRNTFEQVREQWLNSGRTEEDWNNMEKEDRENVIKKCL